MKLTAAIDYAIIPAFLGGGLVATALLLQAGASPLVASELVVATLVGIAALLERFRPERADYRALDQPFRTELAHFLFDYNLGYALGVAACGALATPLASASWPAHWPITLQIVAAILLGEAVSYWQHRGAHELAILWRFHALHHRGSRLNLLRAGRFHFVDFAGGTFTTLFPLAVLRAPDSVLTFTVVVTGSLGVLQHANLRVRAPRWLDCVLCTPAVHRMHHSIEPRDYGANFGTSVMIFDLLFGTFARPTAEGPAQVGVADEPLRGGFIEQMFGPFRVSLKRHRSPAAPSH
jgi:sterol desaturase/sphingolipid hydroxylase (fatty acid hydroxylase superfamily)